MSRETWFVDSKDKSITHDDFQGNPERYGGMGAHMMAAIRDKVITIPLIKGYTHVSIQLDDPVAAQRILREGKIDVLSDGWWSSINSKAVKPVFHATDEEIPRWGTVFSKPQDEKARD